MKRLDVLDGLRGVAVLLVLWYHLWETTFWSPPWGLVFIPATGFIGVHLFFFLSGFVIVYPFARAAWGTGTPPTWGSFAWRRFIKIVPSYILSIIVAYALGYAQQETLGGDTIKDVITHLLFIHTWFPDTYGSINGVLWTLAVEVEFYALFPLIWWCFKRAPWWTFAGMLVTALAWRNGLAHCCYTGLFEQWEENLPGYLDIFAFGMISAYLWTRYGGNVNATVRSRALGTVVAIAGVAFLGWLLRDMYAYRFADQWSGVWQIDRRGLFGLAFAAIALGSLCGATWWHSILANPVLVYLAAISYNLYLYHQLIIRELMWHHWPGSIARDPHYDPQWQALFTYVGGLTTIVAATLATFGFERPLIRKGGH